MVAAMPLSAPEREALTRMLLEAGADRGHTTYSGGRVRLPASMRGGASS